MSFFTQGDGLAIAAALAVLVTWLLRLRRIPALSGCVKRNSALLQVGHSVAMAYVDAPYSKMGAALTVEIRGQRFAARVVPKKSLMER